MANTIPSDTHAIGDTGHVGDHNNIADTLGLLTQALANLAGTDSSAPPGNNATNITAISNSITTVGYKLRAQPADLTVTTVTAATTTVLTKAWTIPANDANVGSVYRITAGGYGAWATGSTVALTWFNQIAGTTVSGGGGDGAMTSTGWTAAQSFRWNAVYSLAVITTGSGGTCWPSTVVTVAAGVTGVGPTSSTSFVVGETSTAIAINTTSSNTFGLAVEWASTTGASTITCHNSWFERVA